MHGARHLGLQRARLDLVSFGGRASVNLIGELDVTS